MIELTFEAPLRFAKIEAWEVENLRRYWAEYGCEPIDPIERLDWHSKPNYVRAVARAYGLRTLVETGSHEGEMIAQVLREPAAVDRVYSVELGDEVNPGTGYPEKCRQRFKGDGRVCLWEGDSVVSLPWMLAEFHEPFVAWLDAHANGPEDVDPRHFPLEEELLELFARRRSGSVILIDDARFLGVGHWPTLQGVVSAAPQGSSLRVEHDIVRIEL